MLILDRDATASLLDRAALVARLERAFAVGAQVPPREHHSIPVPGEAAGTLLTMPAWRAGGALGVKLVGVFPGNAARGLPAVHGIYVLFDATTGVPRALLDGTELTLRRTGAVAALAARHLARTDARRLLIVGTGALAPHLARSYPVVRTLDEIRIWGRRRSAAEAVVEGLRDLGTDVRVCDDLEGGVRRADLVACATLATEPLVLGRWLHAGQHVDLLGAYRPQMREADDAALRLADVYVDTRAALTEAGEFVQAFAAGALLPGDVRGDLAELIRGTAPGRRGPDAITLHKSVGTALADLAAAELAAERAAGRSGGSAGP